MSRILVFKLIFAGLAAVGVFLGLIAPYLNGEAKAEKRKKTLQQGRAKSRQSDRVVDQAQRRRQIVESLKDGETPQHKRKLSLEARLAQAGLSLSKEKFYVMSAAAGSFVALVLLVVSRSYIMFGAGLVIGCWGLPNWVVYYLRKRRITKFINEFPNAVDVIVRGVKAGLPLGDCMRVIASEAAEPVKSEFRAIVEQQTLGLSITEAVEKLPDRVPIAEANFFAIVLTIQQKSGGNLSEALGNLSKVLRDRKKMKGKIKAMSSEAKASAGIIGSLPFIVGILVYISSPAYISLLWTTHVGQFVLLACGFWMFVGVMVMKKMVSFDI